jgi:phosphoglycerol transferase
MLLGVLVVSTVFITPWLPENLLNARLALLKAPFLIFDLLYVAALFLLGRRALRKPPVSMILLLVAAVVALPFGAIYLAFGEVDMVSVLFHLQAGVFGLGPTALQTEILTTLGCLCCLLVACYLVSAVHWMRHVPLVVAALLFLGNPYVLFQAKRFFLPVPDVDLVARVVMPKIAINPLPPDIVYIYLEGLDRRFLAPELGAETAAYLRELEGQGLSFTGIRQVAGTGWTIAGMVASHCGVPLLPRGNLHDVIVESVGESFLPALTCLSDLLVDHGYDATFIMGAEARFAGTDAFFRTHRYSKTITQKDMASLFSPEEMKKADVTWYSDDQMVLDAARTRFSAALAKDAPFLLTIATIGSHGVLSYLSRDCTADGQAALTGDLFYAADCMIGLTSRFVADVQELHRQSGRQNGLRIILQSDHLNHGRSLLPSGPDVEVNTLILIGGPERGQTNTRPGTMLDVFPTLLDWLGFPADGGKAGLGVSLLSPDAGDTLVMAWNLPVLDRIVMNNIALFEKVWEGSH